MTDITLHINKIANGYTVSRSMEVESGYTHSDRWFFRDLDGVKAQAVAFLDSAEADAAVTPADDRPF